MTFPADFRRVTTREALITAIGTDEATFEAILAFDPPRTREEQIEALQRAADAASIEDIPVFLRHDIPKRNRRRGQPRRRPGPVRRPPRARDGAPPEDAVAQGVAG
nr:hypothetical protein [Brevundimonas diminuta]